MSGALAVNSGVTNERPLGKWMPVLVWAIIIFVFSTSYFSAENTSRFFDPILRFVMPGASMTTIALTHGLIRKCAHFTNYAILFWLLVSVPERTPSLYDVALDSTGALFSRFLHAAVIEIA
jgi:VanZ family protein